MKYNSDSNYFHVDIGNQEQQNIDYYSNIAVQRMKSYRASRSIKNRVSKQMVYIYQHGQQHNTPRSFPNMFKKYECEESWEEEVEGVVE